MADYNSTHTGAEIDAGITKTETLSGNNTGDQDLSGKADLSHSHTESNISNLDKYSQAAVDALIDEFIPSVPGGDIAGIAVANAYICADAAYLAGTPVADTIYYRTA